MDWRRKWGALNFFQWNMGGFERSKAGLVGVFYNKKETFIVRNFHVSYFGIMFEGGSDCF